MTPIRSIPLKTSTGSDRTKRPLRSVDPVRFRTRRSGAGGAGRSAGGWDGKVSTFKVPIKKTKKALRQSVGRFPLKPDFDIFDDKNSYQIIATLPYHEGLEDVRCEMANGTLVMKSLLEGPNFSEKFLLPEDVLSSSLKANFKNGILGICLKKNKSKKKKGKQ